MSPFCRPIACFYSVFLVLNLGLYRDVIGVGLAQWLACPPHAVRCGFAPQPGHTKDHHKMVQTAYLHDRHAL